MLNIPSFIKKIFKTDNERELDRLKSLVIQINNHEASIKKIKGDQFPNKTLEFKDRIKKGESLEKILPEAFALVREAAFRTLSERHFDVQLMGGVILHENKILTFTKPAPEYIAFYKDAIRSLEEKIQFKDILSNFKEDQIEDILDEIDHIRQDPDAELDQELMSLEDALSELKYRTANTNYMKTVH